jgi:hypothetical protein
MRAAPGKAYAFFFAFCFLLPPLPPLIDFSFFTSSKCIAGRKMFAVVLAVLALCVLLAWNMLRASRRFFLPTLPLLTPTAPAEQDIEALRSGDLLLFEGNHLDAALVRCWCDCRFSHVGLVWRDPVNNNLYVYNSDVDPLHMCALSGEHKEHGGVQLNDLPLKVGLYRGRVFCAPLAVPLTDLQLAYWRDTIMPALMHCEFRSDTWEMAHTAFPNLLPLQNASCDRMLCTELVAFVYRALGVLPLCAGQQSPDRLLRYLRRQKVLAQPSATEYRQLDAGRCLSLPLHPDSNPKPKSEPKTANI